MKCPSCGKESEEGANFCSKCGAALVPAQQGSLDALIEDYRRALGDKPDDANTHYNLGLAYRLRGLDQLALIEFERAKELAPEFADVHYQLALLFEKEERWAEAIQSAQAAVHLEPANARARKLLERLRGKSRGD